MSMKTIKQGFITYLPEICVGAGIVSFIASAILSAKAAPKAQKAKEEVEEIKETMDEAREAGETASDELDENGNSIMVPYTEEDYKSDMKLYIGKKIVYQTKPYIPTIVTNVAGIILVLTGLGILKKRHAAALSLVASLTTTISNYRKRVVADQGRDKDLEYLTGKKIEKTTKTGLDENGNEAKVELSVLDDSVGDIPWLSPYAVKITPENCSQFKRFNGDPIYVAHWLEVTQEMLNTQLHTNGIIYLDVVLDTLGVKLDETNSSLNSYIAHNVGWIDTDFFYESSLKRVFENPGDRYIDFGCWNDQGELRLTQGKNGDVYLDFNVDGWINGRIPRKHGSYVFDQIEKYPEIEK